MEYTLGSRSGTWVYSENRCNILLFLGESGASVLIGCIDDRVIVYGDFSGISNNDCLRWKILFLLVPFFANNLISR